MAIVVTDSFNRANETPMAGNWTGIATGGTTLNLTTNRVVPNAPAAGDASSFYSAVTWPNDQYSVAQWFSTQTATDQAPGVSVRAGTAGAFTLYVALVNVAATTNNSLFSIVAGVSTNIWRRLFTPLPSGGIIKLSVQGTTLKVFLSNAVGFSQSGADATDATITTGSPGLYYSATDASAALDNWEGGNFLLAANIQGSHRPAPFKPGKPYGKKVIA